MSFDQILWAVSASIWIAAAIAWIAIWRKHNLMIAELRGWGEQLAEDSKKMVEAMISFSQHEVSSMAIVMDLVERVEKLEAELRR